MKLLLLPGGFRLFMNSGNVHYRPQADQLLYFLNPSGNLLADVDCGSAEARAFVLDLLDNWVLAPPDDKGFNTFLSIEQCLNKFVPPKTD